MKEKNNNLITLLDQAVKQELSATFKHNDINFLEVQDHTIPNALIADLDYSDLQYLALNLLMNHWNIDHIERYESLEHMEDYKGTNYTVLAQDADYMEVINVLIEPLSECISNYVNNVENNEFLTYYDKITVMIGETYFGLGVYLIDGSYTIIKDKHIILQ